MFVLKPFTKYQWDQCKPIKCNISYKIYKAMDITYQDPPVYDAVDQPPDMFDEHTWKY